MTEPAENTAVAERPTTELAEFRGTVDRMGDQFLAALPQHVSVDKFQRTVITAVTMQPELLGSDRRTLLASCMKAASDGLLLDNRDAALVRFGREVQYMPMVGGILKRMRQSGEIKAVCTDVVYAGDEFDYWTDENGKHLTHRPALNRGEPTHAYAIINTHDGGIYIEVMDAAQVEKVRAVSRTGSSAGGPWSKWWDQMARKTVLRRLAKTAPMSTDLGTLLHTDDDFADLGHPETQVTQPQRTRPRVLDAVAGIGHETVADESAMAAAVDGDEKPRGSI